MIKRTRSPTKRWMQKTSHRYRIIDGEGHLDTIPQYFQISVNILEARKLNWLNSQSFNSYVIAVLGKNKYRTAIRKNMEEPVYGQYFTFELYMSMTDIQRSYIWLAVMEPRRCTTPRLMGEVTIDLGTIWVQPYHQAYHRWTQLSLPRNPAAGVVGFLKVDIAIVSHGDVEIVPMSVREGILPTGSEQQPANYVITIYGAFGLHVTNVSQGNRRYRKLPSSFVKVFFCGVSATTAIQSRTNHPKYSEQISIVEMFPNINEVIRLEVCSGDNCFNKILACAQLKLGEISHEGENGFLPTFGPSLLHMYGDSLTDTLADSEDGPYHRGALLVSLKTLVPYYQQALKTTNAEPVLGLQPQEVWTMEDFCIFCPILEVSMLDLQTCGKLCGIAITVAELPTEDHGYEDFTVMMNEIKTRKLYYTGSLEVMKSRPVYGYLEFETTFPVLQLAVKLPDFRFSMYRKNMVYRIVNVLESIITDVERRLKCTDYNSPANLLVELNQIADETSGSILKFLDIIQCSHLVDGSALKFSSELDQKQLELQKEEMEKIYKKITNRSKVNSTASLMQTVTTNVTDTSSGSTREVKLLLAEMKTVAENLRRLLFKVSEGWPDIVLWLLNGGTRVAYHKMSLADVIYSIIPEQNGKNCGRIQSIYLKPLNCSKHLNSLTSGCHCIAGKVEILIWMGLYRQNKAFESSLPIGYRLKVRDYEMYLKVPTLMTELRIFIYRGKFDKRTGSVYKEHYFVRINALNEVRETKIKSKSANPVWDQILKIPNKLCSSTYDRLTRCPPTVLIEVYDNIISDRSELIGFIQAIPVVNDKQDYAYSPRLQWYEVFKGAECTGQILMSVQLSIIPETEMKNTVYTPIQATYTVSEAKESEQEPIIDKVERIPLHLVPKLNTYKIDVFWWGLRELNTSRKPCVVLELDELTLKSDLVTDKKGNCNFPNGKTSAIFQATLNELRNPPIIIRLYDSSTFGRTLFLGTNIINNPKKYFINWLPKIERESLFESVSILPSNFIQVNQKLFIKKHTVNTIKERSGQRYTKKSFKEIKLSFWNQICCTREPNEEEYVLLPMFTKPALFEDIDHLEAKDWWTRYYYSLEEHFNEDLTENDQITFYNEELEAQPEFSKFKDWCLTLKLYNEMKTEIPETDEELHCGFLKAGIVIYRWPPPETTVAVSYNGVDLTHGFFNEFPINESLKFLVRVYIVRGVDLIAKTFTGKLDPYVVISCGNKQLGDRMSHIKNTLNPIFGKMFEFRCTLPEDFLLNISLYDYDAVPPDELIGTTTIDLEDRIYTKHRAMIGLPNQYKINGPNKWRNCYKPSVILEQLCRKNNLPEPVFPNLTTVFFNGVEYKSDYSDDFNYYESAADRKENICLDLINKWHTMPMCGHHLVPEHIESRSLYNNEKNNYRVQQGKLEMWVDIFPLTADVYIPPSVDITPKKPEEYELRVTIWEVQKLKDKVSDICVRAWICSIEEAQYTDVYYGFKSGNAIFNWRMIFNFLFNVSQKKIITKKKEALTGVEECISPILIVQILDISADYIDKYLGAVSFNLTSMTKGFNTGKECRLEEIDQTQKINLFSKMSVRAWWPMICTKQDHGVNELAGCLHLELNLLPKEKALLMPVSVGRGGPVPLPQSTPSLNRDHFTIICRRWMKQLSLLTIILIAIFVLIIGLWYEFPDILTKNKNDFLHLSELQPGFTELKK